MKMVEFCPKCEKMLKKNIKKKVLYCSICGFEKELVATAPKTSTNQRRRRGPKVMTSREKKLLHYKTRVQTGDDENMNLMPKTKTTCPECGNNEAYFNQQQTRSADEPATSFFKCTECKYSWREY